MKDYLAMWQAELPKQHSVPLEFPVTATGIYDKHLGPAWPFASIKLRVEPASSFEVVDALPQDDEFQENGYLDWAIFGLLDVLMVVDYGSILNVKVIVEAAEYSRVESSQMAFRRAGQDAGRKIIASLEEKQRLARKVHPEFQAQRVRLSK